MPACFLIQFRRAILPLLLVVATFAPRPAAAQWVTESYPLVAGWNAIWVPLDCSYDTVTNVVTNSNITEVWRWNPLDTTVQFVTSPASPIQPDIQWAVWRRGDPGNSTLGNITGNAAYLVKVADGTTAFTFNLKGKPLVPRQTWKPNGLNFAGFPLVGAPTFSNFLALSADLKNGPAIYRYVGGPLSNVAPKNPVLVSAPGTTAMSRGSAYWIQSSSYSAYNGPLTVSVTSGDGIDYGQTGNFATVRITNSTDPAQKLSVGVTLTSVASDVPPTTTPAQDAVAGTVPLKVRGALDLATGKFPYTDLQTTPPTRTLAPGETTEFVLAVDRSALGSTAGAVFQSLIRVTDSLNLTRIDVPVRAVATSYTGLWIGTANVTKVDEVLARTDGDKSNTPPFNRQNTVTINADQPAQPESAFPVRLIIHAPAGGSRLLQQVYLSEKNGVPTASTKEDSVRAIADGRIARVSSATFPVEMPVTTGGALGLTSTVNYSIILPYDSPTNPFVHTYHPDHDNLNARFESKLPNKAESYTVTRSIKLEFQADLPGVSDVDPAWGSTTLGGTYSETITGLRKEPISVSGTFVIQRVSSVATLTP